LKIVNLSYEAYPQAANPVQWIAGSAFFFGIWETMALQQEVIFFEFTPCPGRFEHKGIKYIFLNLRRLPLMFPVQLNRKIIAERPDVVMIHGIRFPLQVLLLRLQWGRNAKIVVQDHANHPFRIRLKKAIQRLADRYTDAYFFSGNELALPWIAAGLIKDNRKVKEIMEVSSVFNQEDKIKARVKTGIPDANIYLWVGHLNTNKNPLLAVRAFVRFREQEAENAELYMIFQTDALLDEIKIFLAGHTVAARHIHLVGRIPYESLQPWFSAADFIISSSYAESSGLAICQGMSCGCIPILTDIPSFRFMIGGRCGLLYEPGNEDALVAALQQSSKMDKADALQKTLQQYREHLSFEAIAGHIYAVLSAL